MKISLDLENLPKIIRRHTKIAARAPIPNFKVCPSWTNSQFSPQNPAGQMHLYLNLGSWLIHLPPFRHG